MRNVRIAVAYDGSRFFGWQRQDGFSSVQQSIEEALLGLTGETVTVHGAGRTDTGVHALAQVAHFHVESRITDERFGLALNAHLPEGVAVVGVETCRDDFHARFDALSKRYLYVTATCPVRPPFGREYCHWTSYRLDEDAMREAARDLIGEHDFRAFGNSGSPRTTTVRTVQALHFIARRDRIAFVVQGNGFLYNMVRTIAGTLLDVGRGRLDRGVVARALSEGRREILGATAPAAGLYLVSVQYGEQVFRAGERSASRRQVRSARGIP
jgi:tRNA pseudouridine38-40 synthase